MLDSWKKMMDQRLLFLNDFCRLYKSGRFYLSQQLMKTPVFFGEFKGENESFTDICKKISQNLLCHKYPTGTECWVNGWKRELKKNNFDADTKRIIYESGKYFFEISPDEMEERLLEYSHELEKKLENERSKYREKRKVVCPVGMLFGVMLVIILL